MGNLLAQNVLRQRNNGCGGGKFPRREPARLRHVVKCDLYLGQRHAIWLPLAFGRTHSHYHSVVVPDGPRLIELVLGYAAAALSTISFAPQAWKVIASRKTDDISLGMYLLTVGAFMAWLAFGLLKREWPLVVSNGICLILSGFILMMKILPSSAKKKVAKGLGG
jgi:MtN3 and saliva related transmembrane protein